jgi:uncharacterized protein YecE (DUF72 family)
LIRVGPAGWSYADWQGVVYPSTKPRSFHPLRYLSRFVDCVEVNATFYAYPRAEHAERWVELVDERENFRFTAKLHRDFTHEPIGADVASLARTFRSGIQPLAGSGLLAGLLVQFPHSFRHTAQAQDRLKRIAELFHPERLFLELRHRSWFEAAELQRLMESRFSLVAIDLPAASDHPPQDHPGLGPVGYLRLHGRNAASWFDPRAGRDARYDYLYEPTELQGVVARIHRLHQGREETYVIANNHFAGKAMANALEILAHLRGAPVDAPPELVRAFPRLAGLTRISGQTELFNS